MAELMASERFEIKRFGSLMSWTAFLTFDLIVLGALVRSTDSGLACPDWPLCYGKLIPTMNMQIFLEWFHRLSALVLGLFLLRGVYLVTKSKIIKQYFGKQILASALLFLVQCILGGLTVLKLLDPKVVSTHLINAVFFFAIIIWMAVKARTIVSIASNKVKIYKVPESTRWVLGSFIVLLLCQIFLGGLVSTNHAGVICPDFPKCYGQWFPPSSFLINIHIYHRFTGYFVLIFALIFSISQYRYQLPKFSQLAKTFIPILVCIQILLGIANIIFVIPHWATVSHLGNAMLIFTLALISFIEISLTSESFTKKFAMNSNTQPGMKQGEKAYHANN